MIFCTKIMFETLKRMKGFFPPARHEIPNEYSNFFFKILHRYCPMFIASNFKDQFNNRDYSIYLKQLLIRHSYYKIYFEIFEVNM